MLVALLPMKGHSERVPNKNLRRMVDRPLYHWVAGTLLAAEAVDLVIVDTDSDVIESDVRANFPAVTVHRRPEPLWGDLVPMHDIVSHLVSVFPGDEFLQTHSTNPLLLPETVDWAIAAFRGTTEYDSLMSVTELNVRLFDANGNAVNHEKGELLRTQDLPPLYEENSCIYVASRGIVETTGQRIGPNPLMFTMDRLEAIDIDEEADFLMAEALLRRVTP